MDTVPLYRRWASHYQTLIQGGSISVGDRMPSVRSLMRMHGVSLSTALQICRHLESEGWLLARPRSGYFVQHPRRDAVAAIGEPDGSVLPDPAQYVGIHERVSAFIAKSMQYPITTNLAGAHAAPSMYLEDKIRSIGARVMRRHPGLVVKPPSHAGNAAFRAILARRAISAGLAIAPDDVLVTLGGTQALNLALRAVAQPGDTIAVESPTFYGLLQILESLGMRALEIPTSPHTGISIEALELAAQAYGNIKAVVVMPHLQNPLGSIMPDAHKRRLAQLCEQYGIAVIEDDTFGVLMKNDAPLNPVKAWDRSGNVIYCASLTKTLAPGMRLGWITAGRWKARVQMLQYAQTRSNEEWSQATAAELLAMPMYDRHLQRFRDQLQAQCKSIRRAIATYFPLGTRLASPDGGMTLWVELPEQLSSESVFNAALTEGILIAPGLLFSNSKRFEHFLRINCGLLYSAELDAALKRLGHTVARLLGT